MGELAGAAQAMVQGADLSTAVVDKRVHFMGLTGEKVFWMCVNFIGEESNPPCKVMLFLASC